MSHPACAAALEGTGGPVVVTRVEVGNPARRGVSLPSGPTGARPSIRAGSRRHGLSGALDGTFSPVAYAEIDAVLLPAGDEARCALTVDLGLTQKYPGA